MCIAWYAFWMTWERYGPLWGKKPVRITGKGFGPKTEMRGFDSDIGVHTSGKDPKVVFLATGTNAMPHFYINVTNVPPFLAIWNLPMAPANSNITFLFRDNDKNLGLRIRDHPSKATP